MIVKVFSNSTLLEAQRNGFPHHVHLYPTAHFANESRQAEHGDWLCCFKPEIYEHTQVQPFTDSSSLI
jgi:hypothetical protein